MKPRGTAARLFFAIASLAPLACGGGKPSLEGASGDAGLGGTPRVDAGSGAQANPGQTFTTDGSFSTPANSDPDGSLSLPGTIAAVVRDFRFYAAGDPSTDPDFENPPTMAWTGPNGWDDHDIVADTLGSDNKPVYKNPGGTTVTTHGKATFDKWYRDVAGTNIHVDYPLPLTPTATGSFGYDSQTAGVPYNVPGLTGDGFFPIDDGTPYQTAFGNQGQPHNYSFTVEIHTVFTYRGGEFFNFRGDDDVFVFINGKLVINLGGIHNPEPAQVMLDALGLDVGKTYPLDFFSAERHITGSNVEFETTLRLQTPPK